MTMTSEQINERLHVLYRVLQYCSQKKQTFNVFQRMAINQERGRLLYALDYPNTILRPVSEKLEAKIKETNK